jgi:hypothetical protein
MDRTHVVPIVVVPLVDGTHMIPIERGLRGKKNDCTFTRFIACQHDKRRNLPQITLKSTCLGSNVNLNNKCLIM